MVRFSNMKKPVGLLAYAVLTLWFASRGVFLVFPEELNLKLVSIPAPRFIEDCDIVMMSESSVGPLACSKENGCQPFSTVPNKNQKGCMMVGTNLFGGPIRMTLTPVSTVNYFAGPQYTF